MMLQNEKNQMHAVPLLSPHVLLSLYVLHLPPAHTYRHVQITTTLGYHCAIHKQRLNTQKNCLFVVFL
jgi:hypothetical protein